MTKLMFLSILLLVLHGLIGHLVAQLVVNVKNGGGDVYKQSIHANTSLDTVTLKFEEYDGTQIIQFIDFRNEIQIFQSVVLGETERGQQGSQTLCFITRFMKNDFITSDAMSKLRQKNPGAIRHPEEDKGKEPHIADLQLKPEQANRLSPYIAQLCHDAKDAVYAQEEDLNILAKSLGRNLESFNSSTTRISTAKTNSCKQNNDLYSSCSCQYSLCVEWYPCGLKYCRGKDSSGKTVNYRCGIKTCRKCRVFDYYVKHKLNCLWDEF